MIVTDGVILAEPLEDDCVRYGPGVKVAPPGRLDVRLEETLPPGIMLVVAAVLVLLGCWCAGGGAGVTVTPGGTTHPLPASAVPPGHSLAGGNPVVCWDCRIFLNRTNRVSSARNFSRNVRKRRSRSHISALDSSRWPCITGMGGSFSSSSESSSSRGSLGESIPTGTVLGVMDTFTALEFNLLLTSENGAGVGRDGLRCGGAAGNSTMSGLSA